jgi:hypothetical protein
VGYGVYCRSVRLSKLLHLSILAAIVSNAVYWQLSSMPCRSQATLNSSSESTRP